MGETRLRDEGLSRTSDSGPSADIALKDFPPWPNNPLSTATACTSLMRHIVIEIHWSDGGTLSN